MPLPMTLLPLPSPPARRIAPLPPPTTTVLLLCHRPSTIATRPSTIHIASVNVGSASGVTPSIQRTMPILLAPLLLPKSEKHPMVIWPAAIQSPPTPHASPLARRSARIHVPLATRTSRRPSVSNNTLLRTEMPAKHVASPSSTGLSNSILLFAFPPRPSHPSGN